jgi:release factor glutamine methyltransferase
MSARAAAHHAARTLARQGVPDATFEAELLIRHIAGLSRSQYFLDRKLEPGLDDALDRAVARRAVREPSAYIIGSREFFGRDFAVGPGVLIPRPETEILVEAVLAEARSLQRPLVLDVGTGTGCIAVSVALQAPQARLVATDCSAAALRFARANAGRHAARVDFLLSGLGTAVRHADIVAANLPYIPSADVEALEPELRDWEPRVALDGGPDGLALIRALIDDCAARLRPRMLALEVGYGQAETVARYLRAAGAAVEALKDLAAIDRVVVGRWP